MTIRAFDFRARVRASERKIRPLVVKRFVVQFHYPGLASLVFRMAITASMVPNASVITGFIFYVRSNIFMIMTTQTKPVLSATLERLVAGFTLVLKLGMTLDHVARGNHRVKRVHVRFQRCRSSQQNQSHPQCTHSTGCPINLATSTCVLR